MGANSLTIFAAENGLETMAAINGVAPVGLSDPRTDAGRGQGRFRHRLLLLLDAGT